MSDVKLIEHPEFTSRLMDRVATLEAEIANLTLLSDSQLANQERITEELAQVREELIDVVFIYECSECAWIGNPEHLGQTCRSCHKGKCIRVATSKAGERSIVMFSNLAAKERNTAEELRANQERLVGEMQEMRQVVKEYREKHKATCREGVWAGIRGQIDDRCSICIKADALLAPKDTPTEPKSASEEAAK